MAGSPDVVSSDFHDRDLSQSLIDKLSRWLELSSPTEASLTVGSNVSLGSSIGSREENQDVVVFARYVGLDPTRDFALAVLSDGIGGLPNGGSAARIATATTIIMTLCNLHRGSVAALTSSIIDANLRIYHQYKSKGGCTLSAILFQGGATFFANIGDSRIYALSEDSLEILTKDDTMLAHHPAPNDIDPQDRETLRALVQFVGIGPALQFETQPIIAASEALLVLSDGAYAVGEKLLAKLYKTANDTQQFVARVLNVAKWTGSTDNATLIVTPLTFGRLRPTELKIKLGILQLWTSNTSLEIWIDEQLLKSSFDGNASSKRQPTRRRNEKREKDAPSKPKAEIPLVYKYDDDLSRSENSADDANTSRAKKRKENLRNKETAEPKRDSVQSDSPKDQAR